MPLTRVARHALAPRHLIRGGIILTGMALLSGTDAAAQPGADRQADFFMISRAEHGEFHGAQKIYKTEAEGLYPVTYCGAEYWVLPYSVAWGQVEVEKKRSVKVETNYGKGWRPLCDAPEKQVTLEDFGIALEAWDVIIAYRKIIEKFEHYPGANRYHAISNAFNSIVSSDENSDSQEAD